MSEQRQRIAYYDNLKFLLITLVVIGHCLDTGALADHRMARALFTFIYSFHMPLFMFVSGLFLRRDRLTSILIAHRIASFVLIGLALKGLLSFELWIATGTFWLPFLSEPRIPWFMFALAALVGLSWLLRKAPFLPVMIVSIILALFAGYCNGINDFLCLSRIIVFLPFFWVGHSLSPSRVSQVISKPIIRVVGACILITAIAICILRTNDLYPFCWLFKGRFPYDAVPIDSCSMLHRAIAYAMSVATGFGVLAITPIKSLPIITKGGSRSLQIFFWHGPIVNVLLHTGCAAYLNSLSHGWILLVPIGIVITLVLVRKPFGRPLNMFNKLASIIVK